MTINVYNQKQADKAIIEIYKRVINGKPFIIKFTKGNQRKQNVVHI